MKRSLCLLAAAALAACTPAPPVAQSRATLWQRYGGQPLDRLIMAWGAPGAETHLTSGARLLTYRRSTVYDAASPWQRSDMCEVTFLAKPPRFRIDNIAMRGVAYECALLARGRTGQEVYPYVPPPYPSPYPYPGYGFYPYRW